MQQINNYLIIDVQGSGRFICSMLQMILIQGKTQNLGLNWKKKHLKTSLPFPISKSHCGLMPNPDTPEVFDKVTSGFFWRAQACLPALSHKEKLSKLWDEANKKRMKAVFSSLDVYTLHVKQL